jgi:hypothetical protein
VRDIKDHGIDRRTDAADRRPVRVLSFRATGRDKADQSSENGSAQRHDDLGSKSPDDIRPSIWPAQGRTIRRQLLDGRVFLTRTGRHFA